VVLVWYDVVWCGSGVVLVWYDVVWFGVVWCGVVYCFCKIKDKLPLKLLDTH
jgi:hypothetical protein